MDIPLPASETMEPNEECESQLQESRDTSKMVYPHISTNPSGKQRVKSSIYYTFPIYADKAISTLMGLTISSCNPTQEEDINKVVVEKVAPAEIEPAAGRVPVLSDKMRCPHCQVEFSSQREQRQHYKLDWHLYNMKHFKQNGRSITEEEFERIILDYSDLSSISGSDSEGEDSEVEGSGGKRRSRHLASALPSHLLPSSSSSPSRSTASGTESESEGGGASARKHPKVYFRNQHGDVISIFRVLLHSKKKLLETPEELAQRAETLPRLKKWAVILLNAGHFAAAIFKNGEDVVHKTIHRYVVRAKRGTAQSSRDSQGNAPRSGGANLRRHNERALAQEIQQLLSSWSDQLKTCELIFLRAGNNRGIFFGGKNAIFRKDDDRIRHIPFACRRSTYNETNRVSQMLTNVECYGSELGMGCSVPISPMRCFNASTQLLQLASPEHSPRHSPQRLQKKRLSESSSSAVGREEVPEDQRQERVCRSQEEAKVAPATRPARQRRQHQTPPDFSQVADGGSTSSTSSTDKEAAVKSSRACKRRSKRQQRCPNRHQAAPEDSFVEERYHFRNQLYTACKTGNVSEIRNLLAIISSVTKTPTEPPTPTNPPSAEPPTPTHPLPSFSPVPCTHAATWEEGAGSSSGQILDSVSVQTLVAVEISSHSSQGVSTSSSDHRRCQFCDSSTCVHSNSAQSVTGTGEVDGDLDRWHPSCEAPTEATVSGSADEGQVLEPRMAESSTAESATHVQSWDLAETSSTARDWPPQGEERVSLESDLDWTFSRLSCSQDAGPSQEESLATVDRESLPSRQSSLTAPSPCSLSLSSRRERAAFLMSPLSPVSAFDILNEAFGDNETTMLHVAAKEGHKAVVRVLLAAGADPAVRDRHGKTPYTLARDKETRKEFRRFMASFPDRYDYSRAMIPGPLTEEMEQERRQKDVERKKEKRKAQKEKQQAKRAEEVKIQKEEAEKKKFLALSDREKRALAAEKRFQQQMSGSCSEASAEDAIRCWNCGVDISGKVPFVYYDYKFCTTSCLRQHRLKSQPSS